MSLSVHLFIDLPVCYCFPYFCLIIINHFCIFLLFAHSPFIFLLVYLFYTFLLSTLFYTRCNLYSFFWFRSNPDRKLYLNILFCCCCYCCCFYCCCCCCCCCCFCFFGFFVCLFFSTGENKHAKTLYDTDLSRENRISFP